jgi:Uma2 family endonuclease
MHTTISREELRRLYDGWANEYLESLPPEHFMESTDQSIQRQIVLESLKQVRRLRPDLQYFSELLVQYPRPGQQRPGQVVPDIFFILANHSVQSCGSYAVELEPTAPYCTMEIVSSSNRRKDYEDNVRRYEQELQVPYYLLFEPATQELKLYVHDGAGYGLAQANEHGRLAIPEVELEVGIVGGWARFWYQNKLVPLTDELADQVEQMQQRLDSERRRADQADRQRETEKRRADDQARHRADAERHRAEAERQRDAEQQRADEQARHRAEAERQRDAERQRADDQARHRADAEQQRDAERQRALDAERRLAELEERLRNAELERRGTGGEP